MTPDRAIETAADYADAMMTARSAKNLLVLLLLLMLLAQLAIFFIARHKPEWVDANTVAASTTAVLPDASPNKTSVALQYFTGLIDFLGILFSIVLACVLLLLVMVMLVGRLIGVSRLTSAFIWSVVLVLLLFPWQAFLLNADFKIPGVLYTWDELMRNYRFGMDAAQTETPQLVLKWSRFVVFPVIAVLILLSIQVKSNRGLRQALGESDISPGTTT